MVEEILEKEEIETTEAEEEKEEEIEMKDVVVEEEIEEEDKADREDNAVRNGMLNKYPQPMMGNQPHRPPKKPSGMAEQKMPTHPAAMPRPNALPGLPVSLVFTGSTSSLSLVLAGLVSSGAGAGAASAGAGAGAASAGAGAAWAGGGAGAGSAAGACAAHIRERDNRLCSIRKPPQQCARPTRREDSAGPPDASTSVITTAGQELGYIVLRVVTLDLA